ncbi:MAG: 3-hydroxyacyl-CoA dehydrogenase [Gammaproteobacteria bacterium]|nr:MAG: 3-hydroxyacyl-CoA dehydrogenase [Gammaproteobacteria bacterium]
MIGAGTMGRGIAMAFANGGLPVTLMDKDPAQLDRALEAIAGDYRAAVEKGRLGNDEAARRLGLIRRAGGYEAVADADLVIEAVFEEMSIKQEVFRELDRICKPEAILASNTSSLDLNRIAGFTSRPERVIGLHFFAPANIMRLLEIVRGGQTSDEVLKTGLELSRRLGNTGVVVGVCYGFVGNRMFLPYLREAELMMLEGVPPERIDAVAVDWGMAMGPHAVTDLSGLDVFQRLNAANPARPDDPAWFRVCDLLCEAGRYGQKSGAGIYRYQGRRPQPDPEVTELVRQEAERLGIPRREIDDSEILERLLLPMINEGALILEEGIAIRSGDIDVIYTNGYGFPRHRGGPMFHADQQGLEKVLAGIERYRQRYGDRYWRPAPLLERLAREGSSFSAWSRASGA